MTVTNTSATNSTDATAAALAAANANTQSLTADTQGQFLTLLVTQLQNQDPLNPMDNAQVTSQIAQLSTVNGINQLNNTLLALSGQMDVSQSMQAAGLIGKNVLVPGSKISLGSDPANPTVKQTTPFGIDVISPATHVTATILDSGGKAVRQIDLGAQPAGILSLQWDGKGDGGLALPDGAYTVQVAASDADSKPVSVSALTSGTVGSVSYASTGLRVDLGLTGSFALSDIKKIMS
ncbi:flagellar hook assembly protein FlgD [Paralcaligenes sp. KSB-10]|uniref:flagellar hook capping FlgD N-terminal domain-containing protein n=1 Tax=Paralcaligenes sp. KSB-10 TaxID=2901142 RepID=UPI001E54FDE0|nr:flagellar hook capping FlgD N-terminal domain-containing protein [Paralcaligenes sp. KSB-10]UHL65313.1 flagellar hook assembly protein FlgD [Paralcaligenes sp. KSB-10]